MPDLSPFLMKRNLAKELEALGADRIHYYHCIQELQKGGHEMAEKYVNSLKITLNRENEIDRCVV